MQGFDALNPPFDRLTNQEIEELKASLDIGYFRRGEVIVYGRTSLIISSCSLSKPSASNSLTGRFASSFLTSGEMIIADLYLSLVKMDIFFEH